MPTEFQEQNDNLSQFYSKILEKQHNESLNRLQEEMKIIKKS
jgi:hypothetical protein